MTRSPGLRSGQVAELAGVNIQTLRYYERRGLITAPERSPGGHRAYPVDTVVLLRVIKAAQRLGFSLDEVAELLDTSRHARPISDLHQQVAEKIAEVDQKIADLTTIREALTQVLTAGCDSLTNCSCPMPFNELAARHITPAEP
jgi:DNA-binding transcriptional MerR regulator